MFRFKQGVKVNFPKLIYWKALSAGIRKKAEQHLDYFRNSPPTVLSETSLDIFTYHGEDGMLLWLLKNMQNVPSYFIDIGAGDGIKGNCTNLAVHFGWNGLFIDQDQEKLSAGRKFYSKIKPGNPPIFMTETVTVLNIDRLIGEAGVPEEPGLMSIDIDGNDYWIWKAITVIRPRIVIIEAKVEFGLRDVVVPYGDSNHHSCDRQYNGAGVEALRKLGREKGYKLVGANKQGYNLFFVQAGEHIPEVSTASLLSDPEVKKSFYPESFFANHTFAK